MYMNVAAAAPIAQVGLNPGNQSNRSNRGNYGAIEAIKASTGVHSSKANIKT
jgi:hypothetical protein